MTTRTDRVHIVGVLTFALGALFLFAACGDDTATTDAGDDGSVDATAHDVVTQDSATKDAIPPDSSTDSGATDAAKDAATDAPRDAAPTDAATDGSAALKCTSTGGTVTTASCCKSTSDFPDTCTIGACGCSPQNSHMVQRCQCPKQKCYTQQLGCQ